MPLRYRYVTNFLSNTYTLFDGLEYNTCGYFASCFAFFPSPTGARKNTNKEKFIIPLQKKLLFCNWLYISLEGVLRNTLIPPVKMTLTMNKMFADIICQTIEREVGYPTAKTQKFYFGFYFQ